MASLRKRTISLPEDQANYIDSLVESGAYATEGDVVQAGIQALQDREAEIEEWLREKVLPTVKAMESDPSRGIPIDEVFDAIRSYHEQRVKDGAK